MIATLHPPRLVADFIVCVAAVALLSGCELMHDRMASSRPGAAWGDLWVQGETVWRNDAGFVLEVAGPSTGRDCYDIVTNDPVQADSLGEIERNTNSDVLPVQYSGPPFLVRLRPSKKHKVEGGSYFVTEDGSLLLSSSPYYFDGEHQSFVQCPDSQGNWQVFEVMEVAFR